MGEMTGKPASTVTATLLLSLCILGSGCREPSQQSETDLQEIWRLVSVSRFNEANRRFEQAAAEENLDAKAREEARFGRAVTLLEAQPKTTANVAVAQKILEELSAGAETEDIVASARYFLARIHDLHAETKNREKARDIYRSLARQFPGHPLAEDAVVKLAIHWLWFEAGGSPTPEEAREKEALLDQVSRENSRADLRLLLGDAWLRSGAPAERALPHYQAALEWDGLPVSSRADALCIVGNLCREAGRLEQGIEAFRTFLEENPFSTRVTLAREAMEAMIAQKR